MKFQQHPCGEKFGDASSAHVTESRFSESPIGDNFAGMARVVSVASGRVWLEPEQTSSCGNCASSSACGANGIGTLANRLEARRFALVDTLGLGVGDRVAVAYGEQALLKAASLAYAIPLISSLLFAVTAQAIAETDSLTLLAAVVGLGLGFGLMKAIAARMVARGALTPRIIRRLESTQNH
jgi:sigma-E factor negative regulatory protein RseC